jgi:hypothetical protein
LITVSNGWLRDDRMKLKISFTVGGIPIAEMEEVNTFPAGLFLH